MRKELAHPGAQLRITDVDGLRYTAFTTNQTNTDLAGLELRHRQRARCEDRIRAAKDTGVANLPFQAFAANQLWAQLAMLACDLAAYTQMLAFADTPARRWEPERLGTRIFETAGKLAHTGRKMHLTPGRHRPCQCTNPVRRTRLRRLAAPG